MIKNFIYLDEYKMSSLSSQIFEGTTEYLVNTDYKEDKTTDSQKGGFASGSILADIIKDGSKTEEKKYLHDYLYTLFEKHLIENDKVADINILDNNINIVDTCTNTSFIKIKGKAIFSDFEILVSTLKDFNKFGKAMAHLELSSNTSKKIKNIDEYAKSKGLNFEPDLIKSLTTMLDYGYNKQFEIQINYNNHLYSTNIKREYLRESEQLLIKKYSRETEIEFVLFGIVTQCQETVVKDEVENYNDNFKVAVMDMITKLTGVEKVFTGKLPNEIIIDPIAIYTEL
jgi:hypothetical protein